MGGDESSSSESRSAGLSGEPEGLSLDTVLELLANRRRRYAIYALLETPTGMCAFDDLADDVAAMEVDGDVDPGATDHREHVAADLHHWHLPVLEDVGVIAYDHRSEVVQFDGSPVLTTWAERVRSDELAGEN